MLSYIKSYLNSEYWNNRHVFNMINIIQDYLKRYDKFNEASFTRVIKKRELAHMPFNYARYYVNELFLIELKGKQYILGLFSHYQWSRYKCSIKRYYPDGKVPTRRRHRKVFLNKVQVKNSKANDCQIISLSTLTGQNYQTIYQEMNMRGWTPINIGNTYTRFYGVNRWDDVLRKFKLKRIKVWSKDGNKKTNTVLDTKKGFTVGTASKHLLKGKYLILVSGHVCSVIDGSLYHGWNSSHSHVQEIYEIEKY